MFRSLNLGRFREWAVIAVPVGLVVIGAFWVTAQFIAPGAPKELVIAAAAKGSPYYEVAQRYRGLFAEDGVDLKVLETSGSIDNLARLKDPQSGVGAAFVQGGLASAADSAEVRSIGRIFYEPVWIFYGGAGKLERLTELVGKRVLIGPAGSATAALATRLLAASGITGDSATLINMELPDYVDALASGQADAGFLVLAPEARTIRRLLAATGLHLMNLIQADAYAQRFPFLQVLSLKEGVVDFAKDIPPTDTQLLATTAALIVRKDLHPELANLLAQAALEVHNPPMLDANGESRIFQRAGTFPISADQEFPLSPDAARVYKSGKPFLQRYLPFWLATWLDQLALMMLPIIGVLLPALRLAPTLYAWRVRMKITVWYRKLVTLESEIGSHSSPAEIAAAIREIDRMERAINRRPIPVAYVHQLYELRSHLEVARRGLVTLAEGHEQGQEETAGSKS